MKLQFEPDLDYQLAAIEAVCDLFAGQEINRTEFTVTLNRAISALPYGDQGRMDLGAYTGPQGELGMEESQLGIGNRLSLVDEEILTNLQKVQRRGEIAPELALQSGDFTVEMETGTGKTYVYLRTIFELNKRFGFTKFVIVVPSVAIKEGVYKTLQTTEAHFKSLYAGVPFDYFLYDSSKLGQVRGFATSAHIQIMVITVGAINKSGVNNLYKDQEQTGGEQPIELIKASRPVIIVDEPQSVDGGLKGAGKQALDRMNPLCTLRYSATHAQKYHMIYRLDAVEAYERRLVKQIEVAGLEVEGGHNRPYVKLIETRAKGGVVEAKIEFDVATGASVSRTSRMVQDGDDLEDMSGRALYAGCRIGEINHGSGLMELRIPGDSVWLAPGQAHGAVGDADMTRTMIVRTIREHFIKERRLAAQGIKVLSLFFIKSVADYRVYQDGVAQKGPLALLFEEEYARELKRPENASLFKEVDVGTAPALAHDGYFSVDKKGGWTETAENNDDGRKAAERAYNLIMKDKERLLSFDTPLKFIFSHSALREGWDNPNVFQICNFSTTGTERWRRQTIGRGLRLCVDQTGNRRRDEGLNTLTVIADEPYAIFAEKLQNEMVEETGIKFGYISVDTLANIPLPADAPVGLGMVVREDGLPFDYEDQVKPEPERILGKAGAQQLVDWLTDAKLVDRQGKITDDLRRALRDKTLVPPAEFISIKDAILAALKKVSGRIDIKDANDRMTIGVRKEVLMGAAFQELWSRIKHKTTYRVDFDTEELVSQSIHALDMGPSIPKTVIRMRKASLSIGQGGIVAKEIATDQSAALSEQHPPLPDVLSELQDRTQLTRRTIARILTGSARLNDLKRNPQAFIDLAGEVINRTKRQMLVDGIRYERIGDQEYFVQELFEANELKGYLQNSIAVSKSVHERVVYDSAGIERTFAEDLEKNEAVKVYAKLPSGFRVPTPLGDYNPDWAIVIERDAEDRVYFVVETKGSLFEDDLRQLERAKIACGKAHFKALGNENVTFKVATKVSDIA
jgi:type III restriction enzyme